MLGLQAAGRVVERGDVGSWTAVVTPRSWEPGSRGPSPLSFPPTQGPEVLPRWLWAPPLSPASQGPFESLEACESRPSGLLE
uniref:Uncharacterized protein n=1 Tax=Peromyscus maniculatus bairdii TaxID=230844 RepID=A0A8C9CU46_PERMB